tara:strand:+ start:2206 stop:2511 length:306 start_codon:yes stop_codon:yes gene_type:complete
MIGHAFQRERVPQVVEGLLVAQGSKLLQLMYDLDDCGGQTTRDGRTLLLTVVEHFQKSLTSQLKRDGLVDLFVVPSQWFQKRLRVVPSTVQDKTSDVLHIL